VRGIGDWLRRAFLAGQIRVECPRGVAVGLCARTWRGARVCHPLCALVAVLCAGVPMLPAGRLRATWCVVGVHVPLAVSFASVCAPVCADFYANEALMAKTANTVPIASLNPAEFAAVFWYGMTSFPAVHVWLPAPTRLHAPGPRPPRMCLRAPEFGRVFAPACACVRV
jgi:hypothetical protein